MAGRYYKSWQLLILQIVACRYYKSWQLVYYKSWQLLLQIVAGITNRGKFITNRVRYYITRQLFSAFNHSHNGDYGLISFSVSSKLPIIYLHVFHAVLP